MPDPYYIGAIAVGALIFAFMFWGFGFLRLSTGGLSAQATGAGDSTELVAVLVRASYRPGSWHRPHPAVAHGLGRPSVSSAGRAKSEDGETYFSYRIWAAPAALTNYSVMGWFIGQGRAKLAFVVQLFLNLTNMALSAFFVLGLGMTSDGVGLAALIAEWSAVTLALVLAAIDPARHGRPISWPRILDRARSRCTLLMNGDVMIRTLCLVFAFGWFTARGARAGDVIVAANAVLLNLFEVSAYLIDGFAYASEALVGQAVGARKRERFRRRSGSPACGPWWWAWSVRWSSGSLGPSTSTLMTVSAEVRETARIISPGRGLAGAGVICFQFDGIFTGAMATKDMRNMMIVSLGIFMLAWWLLEPPFGNHGLWAALNIFFVARGITFATRMRTIEGRAFG